GLKRLSYRGYDSWGFGVVNGSGIKVFKQVGDIEKATLPEFPRANIGVGHTRWATNGGVTEENAHPHTCSKGELAVVHNGIVENAEELKDGLDDHEFKSQTDTEVIAHLISGEMEGAKDFPEAVRKAFLRLEGRNAIVAMHKNFNGIVGIKKGSPLVVGEKGEEYFIGSDPMAFSDETNDVIYVDDDEMVVLN
ncbi:MAG: class II glutamine amidotransferase, partial [Candidatus Aenigmatarchaeota archaeon]